MSNNNHQTHEEYQLELIKNLIRFSSKFIETDLHDHNHLFETYLKIRSDLLNLDTLYQEVFLSNFDKNEYGSVYNIFEAIARDYNDNLDRKNLEKNSQINTDVFRKIKEESAKWAFVENDYKKDIDKLCRNILESANRAFITLEETTV